MIKGNCLENAMAENFFGIMKPELLYTENFESAEAFMKALEEYIDYYNNNRIKSRLKGKSPVQYRTLSQIGQLITCPTFLGHFKALKLGLKFERSNFAAELKTFDLCTAAKIWNFSISHEQSKLA